MNAEASTLEIRGETEILEEEESVLVGFSQIETQWPWMIALTNSVIATAKLQDYEMVLMDADGSMEQQKEDIRNLLDMGVDYLILVPSEEFGYESLIRYANQLGVEVIVLGREARAVTDNVTCIHSDQWLEGQMAAEWLVEQPLGAPASSHSPKTCRLG